MQLLWALSNKSVYFSTSLAASCEISARQSLQEPRVLVPAAALPRRRVTGCKEEKLERALLLMPDAAAAAPRLLLASSQLAESFWGLEAKVESSMLFAWNKMDQKKQHKQVEVISIRILTMQVTCHSTSNTQSEV
ncbi:uncharacterized protein LOC128322230 isoform X3 [Hemicordylus capensis]|uniref:uncharacterized protein LOC128322230 isoform X3 n=1 Tax=Hemicordylus capensis TaxID=884348 RepID=UPI002304494C|nr:uncharacterized protein LOC128322230 isoform X3 [Hemicordylus capensis]